MLSIPPIGGVNNPSLPQYVKFALSLGFEKIGIAANRRGIHG